MHSPKQATSPLGQLGTHCVPSQVTSPPVGAIQGSSQATPQVSTAVSLTQVSPHWCVPASQSHWPSLQDAPVGQSPSVQHWLEGIHASSQRCVPSLQVQALS